jgi:hypothetical protein
MTVRFFVTSAALMIFSWLVATYLRVVPMDTYPTAPTATVTEVPLEERPLTARSSADEPATPVTESSSGR